MVKSKKMEILIYSLVFILGTILGSFLNCVIYRLEREESFLGGRSYCPNCKHVLGWQDLIPLFSFLALRGKCRYCHQKISLQYPLIELLTGSLFILIFYSSIYDLRFKIYELIISCFLIIIFVYDLKHYIIPDKIIYPAILTVFVYNLLNTKYLILNTSFSAFGAAAFFLTIVLISRGKWMGVGDIKLAFLMGLILGWPKILVALFSAFFIGAIIGVMLIFLGKKRLSSEIPFGPFLVTGTFLAMFLGERIIDVYLNLFLLK